MPVALTINVPGIVVIPAAVVTLTAPVAVPGMTIAVNELGELFTTIATFPPILTDWAAVKSAPARVTIVPTAPDKGKNTGEQKMFTFVTLALPIVPLPLMTEQVCVGVLGCVLTVTA